MSLIGRLSGLERRSANLPLSEFDKMIEAGLSLGPLAVGKDLTVSGSLAVTAVYACVSFLADAIGGLPLPIYRERTDGGKEKIKEHPTYWILNEQANPEMTDFEFRSTMIGHVALWGNGFYEIQRDDAAYPTALWPLRPDKVEPFWGEDGRIAYKYQLPSGQPKIFRWWQVGRWRDFSTGGIVGLSRVKLGKEAIGLAAATEEFGGRFFGNGSWPAGFLRHPGKLSQQGKDNLKTSFEESHRGLSNAQRVAVLEEGIEWQQIGIPPEAAQFLESRQFQLREIARWFRVPSHILNDLGDTTYNNIENLGIGLVVYTIRPWAINIEKSLDRDLLLESERRSGIFIEHNVEGLLRGDMKSRYDAYAIGRQWGWLTPNKILALENMNPMGAEGDIALVPLNMVPAPQAGKTSQETPRSIEHRELLRLRLGDSYRALFNEAASRTLRREEADVMRAANKMLSRRDVAQFGDWLRQFYGEHVQFTERQFAAVLQSYNDQVAQSAADEINLSDIPDLSKFNQEYNQNLSIEWAMASEGQIRNVLRDAEEPIDALQAQFDNWRDTRPQHMAEQHTLEASNAVAKFVFASGGIQYLRWHVSGAACPYCQALNGKIAGITGNFINKNDAFQPDGQAPFIPSRNISHGPLHRGCKCYVAPA